MDFEKLIAQREGRPRSVSLSRRSLPSLRPNPAASQTPQQTTGLEGLQPSTSGRRRSPTRAVAGGASWPAPAVVRGIVRGGGGKPATMAWPA